MSSTRAGRLIGRAVARAVLTPALEHEWKNGVSTVVTERLLCYAFVLRWISESGPRTLLDVGPGQSAWPHLVALGCIRVTAVDNYSSLYGRGPRWWRRTRFFNRHYHVVDDDITRSRLTDTYDFVTCLSVLELVDDHRAVVRGMFDRLAPGGRMAVAMPYNDAELVENAYALPGAGYGADLPYRCRQCSRVEVDGWLQDNGARLVEMQLFRCFTGPYWTMGERLAPPVPATKDDVHHLACMLFEKE